MTDAELHAFLADADGQIVPLEPLLALGALDDDQLQALIESKTRGQAAAINTDISFPDSAWRVQRRNSTISWFIIHHINRGSPGRCANQIRRIP